ncbi:MAG: hypothetical protein WBP34_11645 [Thermoanaerobaculia bacterium]|jgi:hypothetical protein
MKPNLRLLLVLVAVALIAMPGMAQKTPSSMVAAYDSLAKIILNVLQAEEDFVRAMLDGHYHGAKALMKQGKYDEAAAEMALFANEGDNAIAGIRKRLVEGGHHHNAAGEEQGIFEEGYVLVTREAKKNMLAASTAMRQAKDDVAREAAWKEFSTTAQEILAE